MFSASSVGDRTRQSTDSTWKHKPRVLIANMAHYYYYLYYYNRKKTAVYHTVNGDSALLHTSKTAKIIKVILLRALCQNVNMLLSNITFIIFAGFDV